ncbi:43kDa postsynaptic protein, partial [Parasponia andersonii]
YSVAPHRLYEEILHVAGGGANQPPYSFSLTPLVFDCLPGDPNKLVLMGSAAAASTTAAAAAAAGLLISVPAADDDDDDDDDDCVICLAKVMLGSQLPCSHIFHTDCILRWLGRRLNTTPV